MLKIAQVRQWLARKSRKTMLVLVATSIGGVIILIGVVMLGQSVYQNYRESKIPKVAVTGGESGLKSYAKELESQQLSDSTPLEERLKISDRLFGVYIDSKQYQKAVDVFMAREKISTNGLDYRQYFYLADAYIGLDDTKNAAASIDKAVEIAPAVDDMDRGYVRQDILDFANKKRQELN